MASGVMSTMGGGKFGHGFARAAGTQLSSVMIDQIGNGAASYKAHRIMAAAVVGGTIAEVTGGKFANGAMTAAFAQAFASSAQRQAMHGSQDAEQLGTGAEPSFGGRFMRGALDVAGKIWALPNTIIGTVVGLAGVPFGATISFGNNAIQFENYPWGDGAITLGNSVIYARGTSPSDSLTGLYGDPRKLNIGMHERGHTLQYQALGPVFLPAYLLSGGISASNSFEQAANNYAAGGSWWPWRRRP